MEKQSNVQQAVDKLYSQLFGSIVIPNSIVKQEEEDNKVLMSIYGYEYDYLKYEEIEL